MNAGIHIVRKCPACNTTKITGTVSVERGQYIQSIKCKNPKCGYSNHRVIGIAERF